MSTDLVQGTPEWFAARVGLITGSRIAGVLGKSPFVSRRRLLRDMVEEANGIHNDYDAPPMKWGRDHEEEAAKLYTFLYAGDDEVTETGFHTKSGMGASPDRLVGDDGLVEIKCPYSQREGSSPDFRPISELPHYAHQIQLQMFVTGRKWCDFFQWAPGGYKCERVEADPNWYSSVSVRVRLFMDDYRALIAATASGGPEEATGISGRWEAAAEGYRLASLTAAAAKSDMDEAKAILIELMEQANIDECAGGGIKVQKIHRTGSIDYKELCFDQLTTDVVKDVEEEYRREGSVSYRIDEVK